VTDYAVYSEAEKTARLLVNGEMVEITSKIK